MQKQKAQVRKRNANFILNISVTEKNQDLKFKYDLNVPLRSVI